MHGPVVPIIQVAGDLTVDRLMRVPPGALDSGME